MVYVCLVGMMEAGTMHDGSPSYCPCMTACPPLLTPACLVLEDRAASTLGLGGVECSPERQPALRLDAPKEEQSPMTTPPKQEPMKGELPADCLDEGNFSKWRSSAQGRAMYATMVRSMNYSRKGKAPPSEIIQAFQNNSVPKAEMLREWLTVGGDLCSCVCLCSLDRR